MTTYSLANVRPTPERLAELESLIECTRYGVHMHSAWLADYIECFGRMDSAFILETRDSDSGELAGALPLEIQEVRDERGGKTRQLVPLCGGHSDFGPILSRPGCESEVARRNAGWLAQHRREWDSLRMNVIPQSSGGWSEFADALRQSGFSPKVSQERFFYKVNTEGRWEDYDKIFLHRRLDTVRNLMNQLARDHGPFETRILEHGIEDHIREFMAWYRQRRETTGQKDAFGVYPEKMSFLETVLRDFESKGIARLSMLACGDHVLAYQLDWVDRGIWYYYMPAFDERYAKYSPSKILLLETMKIAFADPAIHEFNFMRGEESYKAQFANEKEPFVSIRVQNPRPLHLRAAAFISRLAAIPGRFLR
jgi:CelD/BcsL family acetyltransferase involved in cellulose biosynthesis